MVAVFQRLSEHEAAQNEGTERGASPQGRGASDLKRRVEAIKGNWRAAAKAGTEATRPAQRAAKRMARRRRVKAINAKWRAIDRAKREAAAKARAKRNAAEQAKQEAAAEEPRHEAGEASRLQDHPEYGRRYLEMRSQAVARELRQRESEIREPTIRATETEDAEERLFLRQWPSEEAFLAAFEID
jgi:colicin import membrane protein